jgi:hypothetical protein
MKIISILLAEISQIKQRKKDLRNFGIVFFFAGIITALLVYIKHGFGAEGIYIFASIGMVFLLLGIFLPSVLKFPHKIWMTLAVILGYFFTRIILSITYIALMTPMGLLLRLMRKDLLDLRINNDENSFWKDYEAVDTKERYTKMF